MARARRDGTDDRTGVLRMADVAKLPQRECDPEAGGNFAVDVRDPVLARAFAYVGSHAGWVHIRNDDCAAVHVCDSVAASPRTRPAPLTVLAVDAAPWPATVGLRAIAAGAVQAIVSTDEPDDLVAALESVTAGRVMIPLPVVERSMSMPELSERQVAMIAEVVAGQPNARIAQHLHISTGSVKRELAELYRVFDVANRVELSVVGARLGLNSGNPVTTGR